MTDSKTKTSMYLFQVTCWDNNQQITFWIAVPFVNQKAACDWGKKMFQDLKTAQRKQYSGKIKPNTRFTFQGKEERKNPKTLEIPIPGFMNITAIVNLAKQKQKR